MSQTWVIPHSRLAVETSSALVLKRIGYAVIPDNNGRDVGHGQYLKEQGFYPIGHKSGIIVLSYYDEIQHCIIYEKLVFSKAIARSRVERDAARVQEDERIISFDE
jgi:hypothetical protein